MNYGVYVLVQCHANMLNNSYHLLQCVCVCVFVAVYVVIQVFIHSASIATCSIPAGFNIIVYFYVYNYYMSTNVHQMNTVSTYCIALLASMLLSQLD